MKNLKFHIEHLRRTFVSNLLVTAYRFQNDAEEEEKMNTNLPFQMDTCALGKQSSINIGQMRWEGLQIEWTLK